MCPWAPPRIRRTCCTASTAKRQVLEITQTAGCYTYFQGLDVMCGHRSGVDFLLEVISSGVLGGSNLHFRGSQRQQIPRFARNDNIERMTIWLS